MKKDLKDVMELKTCYNTELRDTILLSINFSISSSLFAFILPSLINSISGRYMRNMNS